MAYWEALLLPQYMYCFNRSGSVGQSWIVSASMDGVGMKPPSKLLGSQNNQHWYKLLGNESLLPTEGRNLDSGYNWDRWYGGQVTWRPTRPCGCGLPTASHPSGPADLNLPTDDRALSMQTKPKRRRLAAARPMERRVWPEPPRFPAPGARCRSPASPSRLSSSPTSRLHIIAAAALLPPPPPPREGGRARFSAPLPLLPRPVKAQVTTLSSPEGRCSGGRQSCQSTPWRLCHSRWVILLSTCETHFAAAYWWSFVQSVYPCHIICYSIPWWKRPFCSSKYIPAKCAIKIFRLPCRLEAPVLTIMWVHSLVNGILFSWLHQSLWSLGSI